MPSRECEIALISLGFVTFKIICVEQNGELLQANAELRVKTAHLEQMLEIDALTEVANRKKAEKALGDLQKQGDKVLKEISKRAMEIKDAVSRKTQDKKESKKKYK